MVGLCKRIISALVVLIPIGTVLPILRGPLKGFRWIAGSAPGQNKGLSVLANESEPEQLAAAIKLTKKGAICFDIGAHVGLYSLAFSKAATKVISFEPMPLNLMYLERHLLLNKITNCIIVPFAISGKTKLTTFMVADHSSEGRIDSHGDVPVFSVSLDDFIQSYGLKPDIIKIDVEGGELDVLTGGEKYLREIKPILLLSTHGDDLKRRCISIAEKYGYINIAPLNAKTVVTATEFLMSV